MASYWAEVLADSPTFLLKCQEASGNLSNTQSGSNGVVSGTALTYRAGGPDATGIPYAVTFNSGSIATVADFAGIDLGDGSAAFSFEFWMKQPAHSAVTYVIAKKNATDATADGFTIYKSSTDSLRLANGQGDNHINSTVDSDTGWHHWVFSKVAGGTGTVYRDGSSYYSSSTARTFGDNNDSLIIGAATAGWDMAGFAVYKSELSSGRVSAHYAARSTADSAGGTYDPFGMSGFWGV
jgi:hypothetical protein